VEGFDLGLHREGTRYEEMAWSHAIHVSGNSEVTVELQGRSLPPRPLVARALPIEWIRRRLTLPGGTSWEGSDLRLTATCEAVLPAPGADPREVARDLPVVARTWLGRTNLHKWRLETPDGPFVRVPPGAD
jgi:hypothetical protein